MKGGLLVMGYAVRALAQHGGLDRVSPLRIVVVSDEEVGSPEGAGVISRAIASCRSALVFESGRAQDAIITRRKGTGAFRVVAQGKAAHAGNNHAEGKNAIWSVARFIDAVQGLTDYGQGLTVNVGKVSGGRSKNTVPDFAEAAGDFRFVTDVQGEALWKKCQHLLSSTAVEGTTLVLEGGTSRKPLEKTPESAALMEAYAAHARAVGLGGDEAPRVGGGSDASTASAMGIPAIDGLGPRGKGFHTLDEYIEFDTLIPKTQALVRFLAG
jgi:glutamate carboxypeptidase